MQILAAALVALAALFLALLVVLARWGMRWGSTADERARPMPGDDDLAGGPPLRLAMTRAISIGVPPEHVWPWLAQLGRGAGWYSFDRLDNGGKTSARHLVSWIPEPRRGDAVAIGYLRHLAPGRSLAWWLGGARFVGARACMVTSFELTAEGTGTRLVSRISLDAGGPMAVIALPVFVTIDSIMACRQLIVLRERVEAYEGGHAGPEDPETGARDQYQLYEVLYAGGGGAGVRGRERAARARRAAIEDGVLEAEEEDA